MEFIEKDYSLGAVKLTSYKQAKHIVRSLNLDSPDVLFCLADKENLSVFYAGSQLHLSCANKILVKNVGKRFENIATIIDECCEELDKQQSYKLFKAVKDFMVQHISSSEFSRRIRDIESEINNNKTFEPTVKDKCQSMYTLYSSRIIEAIDLSKYDRFLVMVD